MSPYLLATIITFLCHAFTLIHKFIRLNATIISLMPLSSFTSQGWTGPLQVMVLFAMLMDLGDAVGITTEL